MFAEITLPDIDKIIDNKDWKALKTVVSELTPQDIAEIVANLEPKDAILLFRLIPKGKATDVFSELETSLQELILTRIADREIKALIEELSPDDRTALFEDLPGQLTQRLLNLLPLEKRKESLELLGFPEDSVGRLMTPDYVAVRPDWTIEKSFKHIRKFGKDAETIDMIYVVDESWKLKDDIPIRRFILAEQDRQVREIMDKEFIAVQATEDQEEAYKTIKKYNLNVLPVTDDEGTLIGIVTVDDILDVVKEEVDEDFQKTSAILPFEESYYLASSTVLYRKRIGWLMILLVTDFLSSSIIAHFEYAIKAVIALAFFIPILIDSGGNIASQSSTLIIRALATGDLTIKKFFHVFRKEMLVGVMIGLTLGIVLYLRGFFWRGGPTVGMVVGMAMFGITLWSNLLGSLLPIVLTKFKLDPAIVSGPLLTTVVDSTGLIIYFSLAKIVFGL